MKRYSARDWLRALGRAALCGVAAIACWLVVLWTSRGMPQAFTGAVTQGKWLLPAAIVLLSPVLLAARRSRTVSTKSSDA
jgi:hypothetical protein